MKGAVLSIAFISITLLLSTSGLDITNPPTNITVCINTVAEINCGFTGADPNFIVPNWRIIMRNDSGSIVSNEHIFGVTIAANLVSGLDWVPDLNSGADNAPNSKLIFGPVNNAHNQSSFQCIFATSRNEVIAASSIGTITVTDPPSANITIDETCITSITLSLTIYSHSACGVISHNVNLVSSGRTILPVTNNGSTYTFNGLATNTRHTVTVAFINNASDINVFSESIKTLASRSPNPVDMDTIKVLTTKTNVKITWKEPNTDTCLMSKIKFYDVNITSDNGESVSMEIDSTVMTFLPSELSNNKSNISCILTIVVYNNEEMSSQPTSKTFIINNTTNDNDSNSGDDDNDSSNNSSSSSSNNIVPIIAGVVIPIVVITIIILIIIVLLYLWCWNSHHYKSNVVDFKNKAEENSYGESHNNNIRSENDSVTAYAISGPSQEDNAQSNTEQLIDNSSLNKSPPTLPPKIYYAKLDMRDNVPKAVKVDKEVQYAETKPV